MANLQQYNHIATNITNINSQLPSHTQLIVVSKYRSINEILAAYNFGQRIFAENRVQALLERKDLLPNDIQWHLIGHLQTNKVKYIASFIHTIHSIDSMKLLEEVQKQAFKNNRVISALFQIHIAIEETKFGFLPSEFETFIQHFDPALFPNVNLCGIMAMASNTSNIDLLESEFKLVQNVFKNTQKLLPAITELSIGMSSDYLQAIKYGATMVRIGSGVFENLP